MFQGLKVRRTPLLLAVLLSLLLHLGLVGGGLLSFSTVEMPDDPVLHKLSNKLEGVSLADEAQGPLATLDTIALLPLQDGGQPLSQGDASAAAARPVKPASPKLPKPKETVTAIKAEPVAKLAASEPVAVLASAPVAVTPAPAASSGDERVLPPQRLAKFPDVAHLEYGLLTRGLLLGRGAMSWQRTQGRYHILTTVKPIIGPVLRFETNGKLGKNGLQPDVFAAERDGQPREFARFDWAAGVLEFGDKETKRDVLQTGALDWLSLGFELALRGEQPGAAPRQVTTGKKVYEFALQVAGETEFDTGAGIIRAVVVRARNDKDLIEFWLAPDFANIPVRIMRIDNDKRFELRATKIEFNGAVLWTQPPPQGSRKHEN